VKPVGSRIAWAQLLRRIYLVWVADPNGMRKARGRLPHAGFDVRSHPRSSSNPRIGA
jgi:hypothetical protein